MTRDSRSKNFYRADAGTAPEHLALQGKARADVCVVGGGFTGTSAALHLASQGAQVILVEAETAGFAASGRNGGQIHTGYRQTQRDLERWLGPVHARDLWDLSEEAKALVRELVAAHAIACSLKDGLVIAADDRAAIRGVRDETEYLAAKYNYGHARMMDAGETSRMLGTEVYPAARFDAGGGHIQPLAFVRGIANAAYRAGTKCFEHTRARGISASERGVRVLCDNGAIEADYVVLACDATSGEVAPELAPFIAKVESFIIATEPLDEELFSRILPSDAAVADTRHVLDYYRKSHDRRMLFGGRESYLSVPNNVEEVVRPRMERVYPALKNIAVSYAWSGTVGITRTRMPHFGRIGPRILFAHGYSGQGVALATLGGKLLAEAVTGRTERFDVMAGVPARPFPGGVSSRQWLVAAGLTWYKVLDHF